MFLINASQCFEKGDPKNYIPDEQIERIASAFLEWREEDKFSKILTREDVARTDYNISPSRYIHVAEEEEYRPLSEIWAELQMLEAESAETYEQLKKIMEKLGV